jgi:alkylated DNA repair dioxygenase AlkB
MQFGIFNSDENKSPDIDGLIYLDNFLNRELQKELLDSIDKEFWLLDLKRRVQHYGYKYDYQKRGINLSMKVGNLPFWSAKITDLLIEKKHISFMPDQLIVNEYIPGQGIAPHIDCEPCFEGTIISISLGSTCQMDFYSKDNHKEKKDILLKPGSLLVLSGEARYKWLHGITGRKSDLIQGEKAIRQRRVSLTYRKVILSQ